MSKRFLQIALVCILSVTMLGAGKPNASFDKIGHKLMCQCSCGQILLECNHVGCPVSGPMIDELHAQIATGLPEAGVLNWFIGKYGPIVLAEPIRGGFDDVAWIVPCVIFVLATLGVVLLIRMWHRRHAQLQPAIPASMPNTTTDTMRDRIRHDTDFDS
ncbi:cytochrome c-type biogenesis protein CcmH [Granulicella mallensis]|uniref:Cytochrome c-type biogenesis protein n=1 Tax=Granulicella mallensis (strain ATCC BAA-1857 / DSM 23137 / MP5ACTX8) TaxID=682795 RepID=G8P052_GRAMM|nr:cytochrome c-type biogenesis protein CcmH [Granulicella mallensis]AEU35768.1 cytochrome C biogenesis protein [Granulicella mallensis MP5ACTX8]